MGDKINSDIFLYIKKGDVISFNRLFDTFYTSLCLFAVKYLGDLDVSRSLVQQLFVDLWVKREKMDTVWSVKSFLYTSVRNRCIDHLRRQKKTIELTSAVEEMSQIPFRDLIEEAELDDLINKSVNHLPEKCREIFILCKYEGLTYSDVAQRLNLSVKTVEMQMGIALKKLRKGLKGYQFIGLVIFIFSKKK